MTEIISQTDKNWYESYLDTLFQNVNDTLQGSVTSAVLTQQFKDNLLQQAQAIKNSIITSNRIPSLNEQDWLLNQSKNLKILGKALVALPAVIELIDAIRQDYANAGYDETTKAGIKIVGGILLGVGVATLGGVGVVGAVVAGSLGFLWGEEVDYYWDDVKDFVSSMEDMINVIGSEISLNDIALGTALLPQDLIASLKSSFLNAETIESPLILDLDGDGVETTLLSNSNIHFDHDGNGFAEKTAWAGADDGLLVRDLNGNGFIDNGGELFGNNTLLADGTKAANGFEALRSLDSNADGVFDTNDTAFGSVKVWKDLNGNGIAEASELLGLNEAGVVSIDLNYTSNTTTDAGGNEHRQQGSFTTTNGTTHNTADVWFKTDGSDTIDLTKVDIPADILALPNIAGFGNVHDLHTAMALDETGSLKTLVEQYAAETDYTARQFLLQDLIYTWTGVMNVDPASRPHPQHGNAIGDARKLEALEAFLGQDFWGKMCPGWGEDGPNPHIKATPILLAAFEELKEYIGFQLNCFTDIQAFNEKITLSWNADTQKFDVDVSKALPWLEQFMSKIHSGNADVNPFFLADMIKSYGSIGSEVIEKLQSYATYETELGQFLSMFGNVTYVKGTDVVNIIEGTGKNEAIFGLGGNDIIYGREGNDFLYGGVGTDNLYGNAGNDFLSGEGDNDYLYGHEGNDTLYGGEGNDFLDGGYGDDILDGGVGNDTLYGGRGNDILIGGTGNDKVEGGEGDDVYRFGFGQGQDTLFETDGNDIIELNKDVSASDVTITREGNNVRITLSDGSSLLISDGWNVENGVRHVETIRFTNGIDTDIDLKKIVITVELYGTANGETINGSSNARDVVYAGGGNDIIRTSGGNDVLYGEDGDDVLDAANGDDYLDGGAGNDALYGGSGNDTYRLGFGYGTDRIYENYASFADGDNDNTLELAENVFASDVTISRLKDDVIVTLSDGSQMIIEQGMNSTGMVERLHFTNGIDQDVDLVELTKVLQETPIVGTDADDIMVGSTVKDVIRAGNGNDRIFTGIGNDFLYGEGGNDFLSGEDGDDYLDGGIGNDAMQGGKGNDTYHFETGYGIDALWDIGGNDVLDFSGVDYDQLWFNRVDDHLKISINGTDDSITIEGWYKNAITEKVETIQTANHTLDYTQVEQLVQAMSGFNPPAGSIANDDALSAVLDETLKNTWQARTAA